MSLNIGGWSSQISYEYVSGSPFGFESDNGSNDHSSWVPALWYTVGILQDSSRPREARAELPLSPHRTMADGNDYGFFQGSWKLFPLLSKNVFTKESFIPTNKDVFEQSSMSLSVVNRTLFYIRSTKSSSWA
jgi:hypothetical protein